MTDSPLPPDLSPHSITVYMRALIDGEFRWDSAAAATGLDKSDIAVCRDELMTYRLLQPASGEEDCLVPVNPEVAAGRLAEPLEETIRSYRQAVDTARNRLGQLMPAYLSRSVSGSDNGGLEIISDPAEVQLLVDQAVANCSKEWMTVQPGGHRNAEAVQAALPRYLATMERGARVRILYQHTTRTQLSLRSYVSAMEKAGAEVRTADQLAERLFIFDREVAFIPKRNHPDQAPGALVVREPVLIMFLCALFEQFWVSAVPFIADGPGYQNVSDDLRRAMLGLLAQGLKDEVVARRLGMSVRTCRRHIGSLMQELGAESRFEAGVKAAQLGLINLEIVDRQRTDMPPTGN